MRATFSIAVLLSATLTAQDPPRPNIMSKAEAEAERGLRTRTIDAFDGYTLFAPLNSTITYLVDMDGEVVHQWECDSAPGSFYLQDDGSLLRIGRDDRDPQFRGGGIAGHVQRLAPDGEILWSYTLANRDQHAHHDIEPLPNGNILLITWERIERDRAIAYGRDPNHVGDVGLWPDAVLEIRPTPPEGAEIVWQWRAWEHLIQDHDPEALGYGEVAAHPERIDVNGDHRDEPAMTEARRQELEAIEKQLAGLGYLRGKDVEEPEGDDEPEDGVDPRRHKSGDWLHTNSVAYDPELDLIVLSTPEFNELWVIDHSTTTAEATSSAGGTYGKGGDLLWRWGNPRNHGAGDDTQRRLFYQHDPTWIRGDDGSVRLLVFNNGRGRSDGDYSSVEELVLPFEKKHGFSHHPDVPFLPQEPVWTYENREGFFSAFISGAQRLPNGNTFICSGVPGRLFEVTREGEIVWDYYNPFGGEIAPPDHAGKAPPLSLFRGTRLAVDHPGVAVLLKSR